MKHTFNIVLFFILSLGLNAQTVEGTVGSDGSLIPYNVSGGLDETAVDAKIETANALNISSLTSDRTIAKTDFGGIIKHTTTGTKRINIPTEAIGVFEEDGVVSILANGGGKTIVNHSNGLTIDRLQLEGKGKMGTIARNGSDNWLYWGAFEPYVNDNPELYLTANALSNVNNTDATIGTIGSSADVASVSVTIDGVSYFALQSTSTTLNNLARGLGNFQLTGGETYEVQFIARISIGSEGSKLVTIKGGIVGGSQEYVLTNDWETYSTEITMEGTNRLDFEFNTNRLPISGVVGGDLGDQVQVTNFSVKLKE
ncbi:tail fiber protein [Cellulophaga phage phi46:3]|uniref:Structural protein n=1 Tax=Cellulophaga phage phi46:3 TaxID=1327985 RepID=S0A0C3_9CAUD|nr:tail fiber protein [Cellulophaga phage phi46:3]AGO48826.1 structural protein [Cellulophaga phage phi46:3]